MVYSLTYSRSHSQVLPFGGGLRRITYLPICASEPLLCTPNLCTVPFHCVQVLTLSGGLRCTTYLPICASEPFLCTLYFRTLPCHCTQVLTFGGGLLGITYGAMSASWDPAREGSALGWTELQANLAILLNKNKQQQQ